VAAGRMFHINQGPISYRFRDKRQFQLKIAKIFPPPCILRPRWRGWFPLPALGSKTRMMALRA